MEASVDAPSTPVDARSAHVPAPPPSRWTERGRFARFATVGASNTALDSVIFTVLTLLGSWYILAKLIAFTVATANGYFWNRRWTFEGRATGLRILARYFTVQVSTFLVNVALLALVVEGTGAHPLEAQAVCLPITFTLAYLGQRLWTFRAHLHHPEDPSARERETDFFGPV